MSTPLQLLVRGEGISQYDVSIEGGKGVSVGKISHGDSPNYLFVDVEIASSARPGTYSLVFSRDEESFRYPYEIGRKDRRIASDSFTTADMIYLIFPDRFSDGDPSIDSTPDTKEGIDRNVPLARHGGDIRGITDHLDYVAGLGATAIWCTPMLLDDENLMLASFARIAK